MRSNYYRVKPAPHQQAGVAGGALEERRLSQTNAMPMWGGDNGCGCHKAMVAYSKDAAIFLRPRH